MFSQSLPKVVLQVLPFCLHGYCVLSRSNILCYIRISLLFQSDDFAIATEINPVMYIHIYDKQTSQSHCDLWCLGRPIEARFE